MLTLIGKLKVMTSPFFHLRERGRYWLPFAITNIFLFPLMLTLYPLDWFAHSGIRIIKVRFFLGASSIRKVTLSSSGKRVSCLKIMPCSFQVSCEGMKRLT